MGRGFGCALSVSRKCDKLSSVVPDPWCVCIVRGVGLQSFAHTFGMISVEASAFPASRNSPVRYFSQPIRIRLPRFFKIYLYCRG